MNIARSHLLPKKMEEHGLTGEKVAFADKAVLHIIRYYTREASYNFV